MKQRFSRAEFFASKVGLFKPGRLTLGSPKCFQFSVAPFSSAHLACSRRSLLLSIPRRKSEPIPAGWAINREGRNTTNPDELVDGGAMLPLGSERERGGHKGYALAMMVDILCGALSGANWGPFAPPFALRQEIPKRSVGKGIGHFFGAMRIDGFIDADEFKRQIDDYVRVFRATKPAPGTNGPLIPGDPEREAEQVRRKNGVPLILPVIEDLRDISRKTGIPFE